MRALLRLPVSCRGGSEPEGAIKHKLPGWFISGLFH